MLAYYLFSGCEYPFDSDSYLEDDYSNEEEVKEEIKQKILYEDPAVDSLEGLNSTVL